MLRPVPEPLTVPSGSEYGTRARHRPQENWSSVRRRLERTEYWWIASSKPNGTPHVVAVLGIWTEERFYWAMSPRTMTARNLRERPSASVHLADPRSVVIVEGRTRMLPPDAPVRRVATLYRRRFGLRFDPADPKMRCYVLAPRVARTWRSEEVRGTGVRWRFSSGEVSAPPSR